MRSPRFFTFVLAFAVLGVACNAGEPQEVERGTHRAPIINGNVDTTHDAVVFVWLGMGACSGTIIHRDGDDAWVLTAAHCVTPSAPQSVVIGDDYTNPVATHPVADFAYHPAYSGAGSLYDFAVIRITGATASTPVIPAMSPAEENLSAGTQVRHLGYGLISYPNGSTNLRHETTNTINSVATAYFDYLQPVSGPCSGDSGGPALNVTGPERVAGVISGGDPGCNQGGLSGRVSAVYHGFILPVINGTPIVLTCSECFVGATQGNGACAGNVSACLANTACDAIVSCVDTCVTQTCVGACIQDNPNGYTLYRAIYDCVCTTGCATECAGDGLCSRGLGEPCTTASQCGSGNCVDDVCCNGACPGQCEACDREGVPGSCGAVDGVPHGDRPACVDDGSVCGGTCNGSYRNGCDYADETSPCRALGCVDGVASQLTVCDGAGTCPPSATTSCAPYLCNGDVCATFCVSSTDCVAGHLCDGGVCVGTSCVDDDDCPGDLVCEASTCTDPECRNNQDCTGDDRCDNGVCVQVDCVADSDCNDGMICRNNTCVIPPSVSPSGCSCSSGQGGAPPAMLMILLGLVAFLMRRRQG